MKQQNRELIAVVFTQEYDTIVLFEYDFQTNTVFETIIDFFNDGRVKIDKLDWEDTLENLIHMVENFKKHGWGVSYAMGLDNFTEMCYNNK